MKLRKRKTKILFQVTPIILPSVLLSYKFMS